MLLMLECFSSCLMWLTSNRSTFVMLPFRSTHLIVCVATTCGSFSIKKVSIFNENGFEELLIVAGVVFLPAGESIQPCSRI